MKAREKNVVKKLVLKELLENPNSAKRISESLKEDLHNVHNVLLRLLRQQNIARKREPREIVKGKWRRVYVYAITNRGIAKLEWYEGLGV